MSWIKSPRKYSFQNDYGHIVLGLTEGYKLKVDRPDRLPVWVVMNIFVKEEYRGQGHSLRLLAEAASVLTRDQGDIRLGLLRDTMDRRYKTHREGSFSSEPTPEARVAWAAFCSHFNLSSVGPLALLEAESSWSVT